MVAACDLKYPARVGESAFLDILNPGPVHAHRHLVLGFARHRAGVASDALAVIDYEAVFHSRGLDPKQSIILGSARFMSCHPERSEGSAFCGELQIPRFLSGRQNQKARSDSRYLR